MTSNTNICSEPFGKPQGKLRESMKLKSVIMVVDDKPQIGQMLTRFLGKHNYEVLFFTNGKEALAYLTRPQSVPHLCGVNLLLMDMVMSDKTGIELARQVKTLYPVLPIIVMSGSADGPDRDKIFELGADFIPKPFKLVDLVRKFKERGL